MTMGTRERLTSGYEWEAFSRKSRPWAGPHIKQIKARFWRRVRKLYRLQLLRDTCVRVIDQPDELPSPRARRMQ